MAHRSRILIVDDDPLNVKLLAAKLPSEEYEIIRSYNGQDALGKVEEHAPDLILLDIMMPGLDGYEVTRRLKNNPQTRDIPIILITALYETCDKVKGLESGADEFLNKPVDTAEIQARVKSLLSLKQYGEQLQARLQSERLLSKVSDQPESQKEKVLILAEDDQIASKLIMHYLEGSSYHIESFTNGMDTLTRAQQGDVDLILLDVLLPDMDGFEICQRLKEMPQTRNIQIVMVTGLKDMESKVRGIEIGADDFLVKPVNKEELLARVNALLRRKERFDRLSADYEKALQSAITDQLTGLYNHAYFKQFLPLEIERSRRQHHPLTLLLFDIDDFKEYNDSLGHLEGDRILRELGLLIKDYVRKIDLAARYGGEEFAIVLAYTDTNGALATAERLRYAVETSSFAYKTLMPSKNLTISIGVASLQPEIGSIEELLDRADKALYRAKKEGKNRVCVFSDSV